MSSSDPDPNPDANPDGITPAPTVMDCMVFNRRRFCWFTFFRRANPSFRPLQYKFQTGTEWRGQRLSSDSPESSLNSRAIRTSPQLISWINVVVGMESSSSRVGLMLRRSWWTQNHTWPPRRWPKMVPITIVFEERGGANREVAVGVGVGGSETSSSPWLPLCCWIWSSMSSRREVLMRFFWVCPIVDDGWIGEVAVGWRQGSKNRRRALIFVIVQFTVVFFFSWKFSVISSTRKKKDVPFLLEVVDWDVSKY